MFEDCNILFQIILCKNKEIDIFEGYEETTENVKILRN